VGHLSWTLKASLHLEAIHDYIATDSPYYAKRFVRALIRATRKLETFPNSGREVPELPNRGFREVIYKSYRIIYRVRQPDDEVEVLAVLHGGRDLLRVASVEEWDLG